jgi:hypothetical protein
LPPAVEEREPDGQSTERVASIRAALRGDLLSVEVAESVGDLILEGLRASKDVYSTCPGCGKRHPVSLPDLATRVSAARSLVEELEGKLAAKATTVEERVEAVAAAAQRDLEALSDDELSLLLYDPEAPEESPYAREKLRRIAERVLAE